jgi:hypothetical protein
MTTGLEIITDALAEIGAHDLGQSVPAEDSALALRYLNRMVQSWSNVRLMIPVLTEINVSLNGAASYTIGPTGAVVAARPIKIDEAIASDGTTDYPVDIYPRELWDAIPVKSSTGGPPAAIWYDAAPTNGRVYVYPVSTGYTLKLRARTVLASFTLAGSITLPDGYESALVYGLAKNVAGAFGRQVSADLNRKAAGAVSAIKRANSEAVLLTPGLVSTERFQIERGY